MAVSWNSLFEVYIQSVCAPPPPRWCNCWLLPVGVSLCFSLPACPVELTQPVGGEKCSTAPADRGDMGNAQKKPHGRGGGGPHTESHNTHHGHWKSRGSSDKYKVTPESKEKVVNGASKRGSAASVQADQSSDAKGTSGGGNAGATVNLDAPSGALPPPLARLKNEGNLLFKNGQFAEALEKYSLAIQGYSDSGKPMMFMLFKWLLMVVRVLVCILQALLSDVQVNIWNNSSLVNWKCTGTHRLCNSFNHRCS